MPASPLAKTSLALYRLAGAAATPLIRRHLQRRCTRGREDPARLGERFGYAGTDRPAGSLIWIHAASVGESLSALPLIERLRAERPKLNILVTSGTVTSAKLMAERLPQGAIHQYAPVDLPAAANRFLDHWRPALGLIIESEFWPNLLRGAAARGVELALVNGRMSPASFASWRRFRPVIAYILSLFSITLAQSHADEEHFQALGAPETRCLGNLKFASPPLACDAAELVAVRNAMDSRPCWLAASTHPGEEAIVAQVHTALAARRSGLLTVLAPRHPHRAVEIAERIRADGLTVARRSIGEEITAGADIYLADTIGELGLWYRACELVFVGGSLVPKGGQNLLEPAKLDCAILCGPHTTNFRGVAEDMGRAKALRQVADGAELTSTLDTLLEDAAARQAMILAAKSYATAQAGVLDGILAALAPQLDRAVKATA
jgi:3-deoxy-D-manno-octulosonic-acid transferase